MAANIILAFNIGTACGGAIGGVVVDWATKINPDHGRIYAAQFSVGFGIPITFLLFFVYPQGEMPALYILTMFIMGRPKPNHLP